MKKLQDYTTDLLSIKFDECVEQETEHNCLDDEMTFDDQIVIEFKDRNFVADVYIYRQFDRDGETIMLNTDIYKAYFQFEDTEEMASSELIHRLEIENKL